jgi:hypothetical protein
MTTDNPAGFTRIIPKKPVNRPKQIIKQQKFQKLNQYGHRADERLKQQVSIADLITDREYASIATLAKKSALLKPGIAKVHCYVGWSSRY